MFCEIKKYCAKILTLSYAVSNGHLHTFLQIKLLNGCHMLGQETFFVILKLVIFHLS